MMYPEPKKIPAELVRPGDVVYLPYSGAVIEVHDRRRIVWINPDGIPIPTVIYTGWITRPYEEDPVFTDDSRQREGSTMYVLGDMRDVLDFDPPSQRYCRPLVDVVPAGR